MQRGHPLNSVKMGLRCSPASLLMTFWNSVYSGGHLGPQVILFPLSLTPAALSVQIPETFLALSTGVHGVSAQTAGAQQADADGAAGLWGAGPKPPGRQPVEGLILVLRQRPGDVVCGSYSGTRSGQTFAAKCLRQSRFSAEIPSYFSLIRVHFSGRSTLSGNCSTIRGGSAHRLVILPRKANARGSAGHPFRSIILPFVRIHACVQHES